MALRIPWALPWWARSSNSRSPSLLKAACKCIASKAMDGAGATWNAMASSPADGARSSRGIVWAFQALRYLKAWGRGAAGQPGKASHHRARRGAWVKTDSSWAGEPLASNHRAIRHVAGSTTGTSPSPKVAFSGTRHCCTHHGTCHPRTPHCSTHPRSAPSRLPSSSTSVACMLRSEGSRPEGAGSQSREMQIKKEDHSWSRANKNAQH